MIFKTSSMLRYKNNRSMEEVFQPAHTGSSRVCVSRKVRDFTNGWGGFFCPPYISYFTSLIVHFTSWSARISKLLSILPSESK